MQIYQCENAQLNLMLQAPSNQLETQLLCKNGKNGKMLCCQQNCQMYGCVCRNQQCGCLPKDHSTCQFVYAKGFIKKIVDKKKQLNEQIQKGVSEIDKIYDSAIERLSKDKQGLRLWKTNYGLNADEVNFLELISENKLEKITGNLVYKIKANFGAVAKEDWLNEKWVSEFWKDQKSKFSFIFSKLNKHFREFIVGQTISKISVIDSKIIQTPDIIIQFIPQPVLEFNLLYRASEHNFSTKIFHQKCDLKPNTLLIVQTQFGKIIGAFTPLLWKTMSGRQILPDLTNGTFLFSVTMNEKYTLVSPSTAIENYETVGPRFGGTDSLHGDLEIVNEANSNGGSYFNFPTSYNCGNKVKNSQTMLDFCGKESGTGLTLKQWQVFEVIFHY